MKFRWLINTIRIIIVSCIVVFFVWFFYGEKWYENYKNTHKPVGEHAPITLSTWMVDWDWEASKEDTIQLNEQWDSIQLFLGYFDENDQVIWNDDLISKATEIRDGFSTEQSRNDAQIYLTIVNDIKKLDGESIQKDAALVDRIIGSPESKYNYVEQFVSLIHEGEFDGLEIDFENISVDSWPELLDFYKLLYRRLVAEDISLRIVLEPKVDYKKLDFLEGPQYVVMAYNLYGYHSGAGPKADRDFIGKLTAKMESIPDYPIVAIATGGFDWGDTGKPTAISEEEAKKLELKAKQGSIVRDNDSGAITFTYTDDLGDNHTVWYADQETLIIWIEMIQQRGFSDIAIWRMGNISDDSLAKLKEVVN